MDGTNCAGRKVSLLNDHEPPNYLARLNSFAPTLRSRTSSYDSSSIGSPPTPQLVRSHSSDSSMQTPSPITPDFVFENQDPSDYSQTSFFPQQKDNMYPPMQHIQGALPYPSQQAHPVFYPQPSAAEHAQSAAPQQNGRPKKNQYPCPMAKQYNCPDFFTTSGHAARHAKKHTGKKDAVCPECLKAFTRKDNMEQHRRTHQSGRGATKTNDRDAKKLKLRAQQDQRPKLEHTESSASTPTLAQVNVVDPSLAAPSPGLYDMPMQHGESFDYNRYPDPAVAAYQYGGLNALANAASSIPMDPVEDEEDEVNGRYHH